jgi:uncharacterized protein GlcG (DUF336 family)
MASLSLRRARTIIRKTLEAGRAGNMKPLSVIVLDAGGNIQAFEREDGASPGRFQIAYSKAYGSVMLGIAGTAQKKRADEQAYFITAAGAAFGGHLVPVPGGVLVKDAKGNVVAAVGVTGDTSDNDAAAATAGIEAVGLVAEI